jgi:hypothetical protein
MLFVLVMEALNAALRCADTEGFFVSLQHSRVQERAYFYADDMVMFLTPSPQDLILACTILDIFGRASSLRINPREMHHLSHPMWPR